MGYYGEGTYGGGRGAPGVPLSPPAPQVPPDVVPHFSQPFRFGGPQAAVSEQDSLDEIADCLLAILVCPRGYRVELPAFGLPDPTFTVPGLSLDELRVVVETWEPRAVTLLTQYPDLIDVLAQHVEAFVQERTEV